MWLLLYASLALPGCAAPKRLPMAETVLSGRCGDCALHEVRFGSDGMDFRSALSERIRDRESLRALQQTRLFAPLVDEARGRTSLIDRQWLEGLWTLRGGQRIEADAATLAGFNACAGRDDAGCEPAASLPITLAVGDQVVLDLRRRMDAYFPGGHQMFRANTRAADYAPGAVELVIRAERPLHVEGDLAPLPDGGGYRYQDLGFGFVAASTLDSWQSLASALRDSEARWTEAARESLASLSPVPAGGSPEAILKSHWIWIRRNLDYRLDAPYTRDQALIGPAPLGAILGSGYGNCDDLAMLLAALLRRDGVAAELVSVDSEVWPMTRVPVPRTHHVVVYLPALERYVDPSLADLRVLPTGGGRSYPFALHAETGRIAAIEAHQTH